MPVRKINRKSEKSQYRERMRFVAQQAVDYTRRDERAYELLCHDLYDSTGTLIESKIAGNAAVPIDTADRIGFDLYNIFSQPSPQVIEGPHLQRVIADKLLADPNVQDLRASTVYQDEPSMYAVVAYGKRVREIVGDELFTAAQDADEAQSALDAAGETLDQQRDNPQHDLATLQQITDDYNAAKKRLAQSHARFDRVSKADAQDNANYRQRLHSNSAHKEAKSSISDSAGCMPGTEPGQHDSNPSEATTRFALAQQYMSNSKLRDVIDLCGRYTADVYNALTSTMQSVAGVTVEIGVGGDIGRALPSELAQLLRPGLRRAALARAIENQLMQVDVEAESEAARGDVIVCVDTSGSMGGQKATQARAFALATLYTMRHQSRNGHACLFDWHVHQPTDFKASDSRAEFAAAAYRFAACTASGGTSFDAPLLHALQTLESSRPKADVLIVTDGEGEISQSTIERVQQAKAKGMRLWAMLLGINKNGRYSHYIERLMELSSRWWVLDDFNGGTPIEAFNEMTSA